MTEHYDVMLPIAEALYDHSLYIEVGCSDGAAFNRIAPFFERKIAIDIAPVGHFLCDGAEFYQMTSDDFFKHVAPSLPLASMIFVDADHRKECVLRDIQNSIQNLRTTNGILFAHDTYPPSQEMINGGCWDAWEAAREIRKNPQWEVITLPVRCMGLTIVRYVPDKHLHWQT